MGVQGSHSEDVLGTVLEEVRRAPPDWEGQGRPAAAVCVPVSLAFAALVEVSMRGWGKAAGSPAGQHLVSPLWSQGADSSWANSPMVVAE